MLDERERDELRGLVGGYLADRSPESAVRAAMETADGVDDGLWAGLGVGGLGLCGLAVPSRWGGEGHTFAEVAVVLGELGRSLACVPYFSSVVLAQSLLLACADAAPDGGAADRWLPRLAAGRARGAVAVVEADGRWEPASVRTTATPEPDPTADPDGWRLNGVKHFVVDGHTADVLLMAARTDDRTGDGTGDGIGIFEVDAAADGLVRTPMATLDLTRRQARLELTDVRARRVGTAGWDAVRLMLRTAAVGLAAESVGGMRRVLEMAVDHARTRSQFGRPIGSFQAIKHKCADMLVATESADSLVRDAVALAASPAPRAPEGDIDDRGVAASLAHAYCQQAYLDCASENIQVHGGIGFTWEHPAQLYYKRAQSSRLLLGDPIWHRALAAELIDL
ncbi:MAG TPA: acyl-CoA dehydrogenase [Pseudonocardia sp.]|nr:acyl-CoA dehydrogenase [Pseudonocardia sp.]